jgi:hypothetical protein
MRGFKVLSVAGALAAALVAAPGVTRAANMPSNINLLLKDVQMDATTVSLQADELDSLHRSGADWPLYSDTLEHMKIAVNGMRPKVARLEEMRGSVDAVQGREIDRLGLLFRELVANTNAAINYVSTHEVNLRGAVYEDLITRLDTEAQQMSHSLGEYFGLVAARGKEQRLEKDLGVGAVGE